MTLINGRLVEISLRKMTLKLFFFFMRSNPSSKSGWEKTDSTEDFMNTLWLKSVLAQHQVLCLIHLFEDEEFNFQHINSHC